MGAYNFNFAHKFF